MAGIYKTRHFSRWQRRAGLSDGRLLQAVTEMESGLIDADLGGGVVKKRIALPGRGKSGSVRKLVATRRRGLWFFIYGFEKNDRSNISAKELEGLKAIAEDLLGLSPMAIVTLIANQSLSEVNDG